MNRHRRILWILGPFYLILVSLFAWLVLFNCMQEASSKDTIDQLTNERDQLKTKLAWYETEYGKLAAIIAAGSKRREKHISHVGTPWLPFDSQEELEQARLEAEAEAKKLVDDAAAPKPDRKKKPRKESLPSIYPKSRSCATSPNRSECVRLMGRWRSWASTLLKHSFMSRPSSIV